MRSAGRIIASFLRRRPVRALAAGLIFVTLVITFGRGRLAPTPTGRAQATHSSNWQVQPIPGELPPHRYWPPVSGTRETAVAQVVVNFSELAERERLAPSPNVPTIMPFAGLIPGELPVPLGVAVAGKTLRHAVNADNSAVPSPTPQFVLTDITDDGRFAPPDRSVAVGPNHIVSFDNNQIGFATLNGGKLRTISPTNFWSGLGSNLVVQQRALYEPFNNRYFVAALGDSQTANSSILFAVSRTDDPTGDWTQLRLRLDQQGQVSADWPNIGYNKDWVVLTANTFNIAPPNNFNSAKIFVLDKKQLLAATAANQISFTTFQDTTGGSSLAPMVSFDYSIPQVYLVSNWNGNSNGQGFLRIGAITGAAGAEVYTPAISFPSTPDPWATFAPGNTNSVSQLDSTTKIFVGDARIQNVVFRNGRLCGAHTVYPTNAPTETAVQVFFIPASNITAGRFEKVERFLPRIGFNYSSFQPNIALNKDNEACVAFNISAANQYVGAAYAFRAAANYTFNDTRDFNDPVVYKPGEGSYVRTSGGALNRWGNYGSAVTDSNGKDFEVAQIWSGTGNKYLNALARLVTPRTGDPRILKNDNGTFSGLLGSNSESARFTVFGSFNSPSIPATLVKVDILNSPRATLGKNFQILTAALPNGNINPDSINFQITNAQVGTLGQFTSYNVAPLKSDSGRFAIGFSYDAAAGEFPVAVDFNHPFRGQYFRKKNNESYTGVFDSNFAIRAEVQEPSVCQGTLKKDKAYFNSNGGRGLVEFTSLCGPTVIKDPNSVVRNTVITYREDTLGGYVSYEVTPNPYGVPRTATIQIGDRTFTVCQAGNILSPVLFIPNPASAAQGSPPITMTVNSSGSISSLQAGIIAAGFTPNMLVGFNGLGLTTTFVSSTQLKAQVTADLLTQPGTAQITVFDPNLGGGTSAPVNFSITNNPLGALVSAASYQPTLAREAICAAFGINFAINTLVATTVPLPTSLAGTSVKFKDSAGVERLAPLFFVSPNQVNLQIPPGTASGDTVVTITSGNGNTATRLVQVADVAPALFTANANGQGVPAALALRVKANGSQSFAPIARFDAAQNKFVPVPIDLGPATDQVFLVLYGTGVRFRSALSAVNANIGGVDAQVSFAGAQGGFVGLDQINLLLPRSLAGRGKVDLVLRVDGEAVNTVTVQIK